MQAADLSVRGRPSGEEEAGAASSGPRSVPRALAGAASARRSAPTSRVRVKSCERLLSSTSLTRRVPRASPSTEVMRSPTTRPARSAADPGRTNVTLLALLRSQPISRSPSRRVTVARSVHTPSALTMPAGADTAALLRHSACWPRMTSVGGVTLAGGIRRHWQQRSIGAEKSLVRASARNFHNAGPTV